MTKAPRFSLYNMDWLDDGNFVANFVARDKQTTALLNGLRNIAEGGPAEHQILVGARGMGKTSLLRRLAIGISEDAGLTSAFIPLRFREEQYNIISLDVFWRNCGESLAEYCEQHGKQTLADRLDLAIESLEWRDETKARDAFLAACREAGGRPVLLLDNLDLILAGIKPEGCWSLRNALQRNDAPIVIGAATRLLTEGADREAPFYEFFNPHILEPLTEGDLLACLNALASRRGIAGAAVKAILVREPARVRALYVLTGGNPRVLTLIYGLLEQADSDTIFADLETLLDQVTPFYKARVEEYQTPLQRAVIDGIALNWDPITSGALSRQTGVEVTTLSPQLIRLKRDGMIEEVATSGARAGYQLSERFLNIWYLMRHGTRKTKQRLRWFTRCLTELFSAEDLHRMAGDARSGKSSSHPLYREALYEAYDLLKLDYIVSSDVDGLSQKFGYSSVEPSSADQKAINADDSPTTKHLRALEAETDRLLTASKYTDVLGMDAISFESVSLSRPIDFNLVARIQNGRGRALNNLKRFDEAITVFDEVLAHVGGIPLENIVEREAWALTHKATALYELSRTEEAVAVWDDIIVRFENSEAPTLQAIIASAITEKGRNFRKLKHPAKAIAAFDHVLECFGMSKARPVLDEVARALVNKSLVLSALKRSREAITVCEEIISRFATSDYPELQKRVAWALNERGRELRKLKDTGAAISSFAEVLERFGAKDARTLNEEISVALVNRALSLIDLERGLEAIADCQEIVSRLGASDVPSEQTRVAWALVEECRQLRELKRYEESISIVDRVLQRFGTKGSAPIRDEVSAALTNKALSLVDLNRVEEAAIVWDEVVSRFGASKGSFLKGQVAWALTEKGRALRKLKRPEEAIAIFDRVLDRFGEDDELEPSRAVTCAVVDRASCLVDLDKVDEALLALRAEVQRAKSAKGLALAARNFRVSNLEFSIGWILFSQLYDVPGAEAAFREAAAFEKAGIDSLATRANLCWVYLSAANLTAAKEVFAELEEFTGVGRHLWMAGLEIVAGNLEVSLSHLQAVLRIGLESDGFDYFEALLWYLRIAAERGHGEPLVEWFIATGNADRYAPIHGAFVAHVRGERFLLDLNPEVRGVARPLYSRLSAGTRRQKAGRTNE